MPPIVRAGSFPEDALSGNGRCGSTTAIPGGPCGYGPRLPLLVLSPYAKRNFVSSALTDQTSITRFIEDNWHLGRLGAGSMDQYAGPIDDLFDFSAAPDASPIVLDPDTGLIKG